MIDTGDLRKGVTIERGGAVVKLKLKDVRAVHIIERTWPAGSKFQRARVERQPSQFLYVDSELYYFMNKESFEQIAMNVDRVADASNYLKENEDCQVLTYGDEALSVELPAAVVLEIAETEQGLRGDTAQGGTKPARLETGLNLTVPLFVNTGDKIKVDTRTGQYLERAN